MKRIRIYRTAAQRADESRRKRPTFFVLILCLVMTAATAITTAVLGGSLSRFSMEEGNVIPLVPQAEQLRATEQRLAAHNGEEEPKRSERPEKPSATPKPRHTTAPRRVAAENNNTARTVKFQGELQIYDEAQRRNWSSETQVNLFEESYSNENGRVTVKAEDDEDEKKIIAPGTSNQYDFTLKNNSNYSLDYTISLKVESDSESAIPLEWRLLDGDGAAVSKWKGYSETAEVMQEAALDVGRQDKYSIEWLWAFEQGENLDGEDTALGDLAVNQPQNAKATIIVYAEQNTEQSIVPGGGQTKPSGGHMWPKTGDTGNLGLYIVLMTVSGCGLLILFQRERLRKKR